MKKFLKRSLLIYSRYNDIIKKIYENEDKNKNQNKYSKYDNRNYHNFGLSEISLNKISERSSNIESNSSIAENNLKKNIIYQNIENNYINNDLRNSIENPNDNSNNISNRNSSNNLIINNNSYLNNNNLSNLRNKINNSYNDIEIISFKSKKFEEKKSVHFL